MNSWRAEFERQFVGENARPYPRAAVGRLDLEELGVAIGAAAKAPNPRAARRGGFLQPIELRSVAIQDRGSVRLEAEEISAFASAIASIEPRCSMWTGAIVVTRATWGRAMRVSGAISPA